MSTDPLSAPLSETPRAAGGLSSRYGGKRGILAHVRASLEIMLPGFPPVRGIDWSRVDRLIFVCKGNICRSAYAEARARGLGLATASAGLDTQDGLPADRATIAHGAARGVSLDAHRTTVIDRIVAGPRDLLLCMEPPQVRVLAARFPQAQVTLLGLWADAPRPWLFDPYGMPDDYWRSCLDVIDSAVARIAGKVGQAAGARR